MTAPRGTHHSVSLQMAAAKEFGWENRNRLDNLAELYTRAEKTRLTVDEVHRILQDENTIYFSPAPSEVMLWADYMGRVGMLNNKASSWKDFFFENVHDKPGS